MSRSSSAAPPVVLNGRYELLGIVAEGGMAQVYHGRDRVLDRDVAVKVLRPQYAASQEFLERFHREARLAASLAHPNLVNVFDVGDDGDRHYIVMELLPGRTLKDLVARGPLSVERATDLALQVARGMAYAHRRGLVHRDLKPQNVLLTEDGHAKVADFGLAQGAETAQVTTPGTVWGTVQYISPEQAQGLRPDARSDVYSLGALFFELLTGRPPYDGGTPASIMMRHVYDPPPLARDTDPTIPEAAERVLGVALAKSADERYQSMDQMAQALTDLRDAAAAETMVWSTVPGVAPAPPAPSTRRQAPAGQPAPAARSTKVAVAPPVPARGVRSRPALPPGQGTARRRRGPSWLPMALGAGVLAFFALMAAGAFVASQLVRPLAGTARPTASPRATATTAAPTATAAPPTATPVPLVPVPNVIGSTLARARDRLAEVGLEVETAEDFSRDVPAGSIAAQSPAANAQLEQGKPVKLTVSKGPQRAGVPAVIGDAADAAADKLAKVGFTVDRQEEFNNLAPAGIVFDQVPRGDTQADAGSRVVLRISKGRDQVAVPRVIGQPEQAAIDRLTRDGLKAEVTYEASSAVDPGVVFTQDPVPDSRADRGATVKLRVRRDPTPAPTAAPARTATAAPATAAPTTAATPAATAPPGSSATRPPATPTPR